MQAAALPSEACRGASSPLPHGHKNSRLQGLSLRTRDSLDPEAETQQSPTHPQVLQPENLHAGCGVNLQVLRPCSWATAAWLPKETGEGSLPLAFSRSRGRKQGCGSSPSSFGKVSPDVGSSGFCWRAAGLGPGGRGLCQPTGDAQQARKGVGRERSPDQHLPPGRPFPAPEAPQAAPLPGRELAPAGVQGDSPCVLNGVTGLRCAQSNVMLHRMLAAFRGAH